MPGIVVEAPASYLAAAASQTRTPVPERQAFAAQAGSAGSLPLFQATSKKVVSFAQALRSASEIFDRAQESSTLPALLPELTTAPEPAREERFPLFDYASSYPAAAGRANAIQRRVAPIMRRVTAGAMDVAMVSIGFGVFLVTAWFGGSEFGGGRVFWIALAACLLLISLFYGLLWAMARRESAGMRWTRLRLIAFDGSTPGCQVRLIRFVTAWLSYCSGGLGLLWAFADEENLTLHDRISETFPVESP
jgi:uncharacterized RDD family membrane protein YckC